jgi:hypothetical protein
MYIRVKTIISLAVLFLLPSCREEEKVVVSSKNDLYVFLDTLEKRYESAYSSVQSSIMYQAGFTDSVVTDSGWLEASKIFLDTSLYNTIVEWHNRSGSLADKELERRLELWYRVCLGGKIFFDPEINSLRQELQKNYKDNLKKGQFPLPSLLPVSLRNEKRQIRRKEIYDRFSLQQTSLIPDYIRLVKLHNERVKEFGFPNYYSFLLYLEAIDEMWLLQTIGNLEKHSRTTYYTMLDAVKKKYRITEPAPWDLDPVYGIRPELPARYFPGNSMMANLRELSSSIGAPIDSLPIRIIKKKGNKTSRCFVISTPDDVRLYVGNGDGMEAYRECLHIFGKAFHAATINAQYPILKGYSFIPGAASASFYDGVNRTFQEFLDDSLRIANIHGIKSKDLQDYLTDRSMAELYNIRSLMYEFFTEYELYKDPDQNLDTLASVMYEKYLSDTTTGNIRLRFAPSLQNISFNGSYHTLMLRDIISAQLYEALMNKFGSDTTYMPKAAGWIINSLHRGGEMREWDERIKSATGKSVEPGALLRKLRIEHTNTLE